MLSVDTLAKLEAKQEELAILFLDEADITRWKSLPRGDAYWEQKKSSQTLGLVNRLQSILNMHRTPGQVPLNEGGDVDNSKLAAKAEADADALIKRLKSKQRQV